MVESAAVKIEAESPLLEYWSGTTPAVISSRGLSVREQPSREKLVLVSDGSPAALRNAVAVLGKPLPESADAKTGTDPCCIWRAPNRWLIAHDRGEVLATGLNASLSQGIGAAIDVSDGWVSLVIEGPNAMALLNRGCEMDFHPRAFPQGRFAETEVAGVDIIIHAQPDTPSYELLVERALAVGLWVWLKDNASVIPG